MPIQEAGISLLLKQQQWNKFFLLLSRTHAIAVCLYRGPSGSTSMRSILLVSYHDLIEIKPEC